MKLAPLAILLGAVMTSYAAYAETVTRAPAPAAAAAAQETPRLVPNAVEFRLSNGMEVVVIPDHRAPVVTHMLWYKVGGADEQPGQSGNAHFLEHLMFKGTKQHPQGAFSQRVAGIGGEENAFTSNDYTGYYQRVAKEHLAEMMALEADRMANLVLTDAVVNPERDVIREERRMRVENDPGSLLSEALTAALYRNHPYGRPVIGWMHEIEALNKDTALAFYRRYYTPSNAVLVVAGDVTPEEVRRLAEETYGKIPARPEAARPPRPAEPPPVGPQTVTVRHENVREPQVSRAYQTPSSTTAEGREAEALSVLADVLGGGSTSRLYKALVRGEGPATYAGAYYLSGGLDDTRLVVYGVPRPGVSVTDLEAAIDRVIDEVIEKGVTEEELARAKRSVIANAIYSQDSQQAMARIVGSALVTGKTLEDVQSWPARIQEVTAEDVREAARRYLDIDRSVTGYLLPKSKDEGRS